MMTYSLFPELFFLAPVVVGLLRATVGIYFVVLALRLFTVLRTRETRSHGFKAIFWWVYGLLQLGIGLLLFVGLYTQGAAIAAIVLSFLALESELSGKSPRGERPMYVLLLIISFSLLFLGPGAFAIDVPL
jgi:uncharacterized membrane protein YphA (DoxX/SURF4 family)